MTVLKAFTFLYFGSNFKLRNFIILVRNVFINADKYFDITGL